MGFYDELQDVADELMTEFKQGTVTLTRLVDTETPIDAEAMWLGFVKSSLVYVLRATVASVTVNQATAKFIDGSTIKATDLVVTAGPKMTHTLTDGVAADGAEVDVSVEPGDVVSIDGEGVTLQQYMRIPAAGPAIVHKFIVRG